MPREHTPREKRFVYDAVSHGMRVVFDDITGIPCAIGPCDQAAAFAFEVREYPHEEEDGSNYYLA